jgi:hypothetical protein
VLVQTLLSDVDLTVREPSVEMQVIDTKSSLGSDMPANVLGFVLPVPYWVLKCSLEGFFVTEVGSLNLAENH